MATNQEVIDIINEYLTESYDRFHTNVVPKKKDLTFSNSVKVMKHVVVFFIDMRKSRKILSDASDFWSIKIHKSFLKAVTHCIDNNDGHLRSFNGDGILAFFIGENAASRAVRTAMNIKGFVLKINETLNDYDVNSIDFGIGIAQGKVMVAKSGKAGDDQTKQDLVWIGLPVYLAVELSEIGHSLKNIWISHKVRTSIGNEDYLDVVYSNDGESKWVKSIKNLKSVGNYDVRGTSWYFKY